MHARSVSAIVVIVALVAAGLSVVPGLGSAALESYVAETTFPTTVDGVPIDQAPPRSVVVVDRALLVGGTAVGPNDASAPSDGDAGSEPPTAPSVSSSGTVGARTMSSQVAVDIDELSAGDRELLASLGLLDPDAAGSDPPPSRSAADEADEAEGDQTDPDPVEPQPTTVAIDDATVAALLTTRVAEHLHLDVEVVPVIGDHFAVAGSTAEPLLAVEGVIDAEESVLGMVFADSPGWFHMQWALINTGQRVVGFETDRPGIAGVDIDRYVDDDPADSRAGTGGGVVVAVIDTPFDTSHEALVGSWWQNEDENCDPVASPEDTDGNGYVNDCWGWNFVDDEPVVTGTDTTTQHATHVAGTIAANGALGAVVGVAPDVKVMPLVVSAGTGQAFPMDRVIRAVRYAVDNGADVINLSLGTDRYDAWPDSLSLGGLQEAIEYAAGAEVPIIAAAGNHGADLDRQPVFPASFASEAGGGFGNVLAVGALTNRGLRWPQSNIGRETVGLAAPGVDIISALPNDTYGYYSGTSMAAPHVAGAAALLLAESTPPLTADQLVATLTGESLLTLDWVGRSLSGGRLSLAAATGHAPHPLATFTGLGGSVNPDRGDDLGAVRTTVQIHPPVDIHVTAMTVTLATHFAGEIWAVVDHPIQTTPGHAPGDPDNPDTPTVPSTNHEGALRTALDASSSVVLDLALPAGEYAWILEFDHSALYPQVAAFLVTPAPAGDEAPETPASDSDQGSCDTCPETPTESTTQTPTEGTTPDGDEDPATGTESSTEDPDETGEGPGSGTPEPDEDPANGGPYPDGDDTDPDLGNPGDDDTNGGDNGGDNGGGSTTPPTPINGGETTPAGSTRIRPNEGVAGDYVEIHGLWPVNALVRFGDQPAYVSIRASRYLLAVVPWSAYAGPVDVIVYVVDGTELRGLETFTNGFTYLEGQQRPPEYSGDGGGGTGDGGANDPGNGGDNGSGPQVPGPDPTPPATPDPDESDENNHHHADDSTGSGETDDGHVSGTGPRTLGQISELPNGLTGVRLGDGHPGFGLPDGLWPPMCEGNGPCPGIPVLG